MKRKYGWAEIVLISISVLSVLAGLIIIIIFITKLNNHYELLGNQNKIDLTATGVTGDFIGGVVGSIWALAGVFLFVLALRMQSKELSLQIKEMRGTKEVSQTQQFEVTFFNLLKVQHDLRSELNKNNSSQSFFEVCSIELSNHYVALEKSLKNKDNKGGREFTLLLRKQKEGNVSQRMIAIAAYSILDQQFHSELSHYFRHLYHVLKFVDTTKNNELKDSQKTNNEVYKKFKPYVDLVQAQMSSNELTVLFYNSLSFEKMKIFMHRYDFLENLSREDLIKPDHTELYAACKIGTETLPAVNFKSRRQIIDKI